MDYDAILKKMNLYYFEGKLQQEVQVPQRPEPQRPEPRPQVQVLQMTKEQFIQLKKQQLNEKKRIQIEQLKKRKLLLSNITTQTRLKQMNIQN
uniref:Uncharacterized protein n=1 Tax=viral metagenome TaxID=1070528 RepID=A0A6C0HRL7_9ZZZZ